MMTQLGASTTPKRSVASGSVWVGLWGGWWLRDGRIRTLLPVGRKGALRAA
jgi:hypothetical protein